MVEFASTIMPIDDDPEIRFDFPGKQMRRAIKRDRFFRDYGLTLLVVFLWAASMMIGCGVTGVIVHHNAMLDIEDAKKQAVNEYKAEQALIVQAEHWKSGEASREAAMNQDVELLARWMSFFSTDRAKLSFGGNVLVRWLSSLYEDDLRSVLTEKDQFSFGNEDLIASERDKELAKVIWSLHEQRMLPAGLTMQHLYGEVRDGGQDYVVRNEYQKSAGTDYWRWPEGADSATAEY